MKDNLLKYLTEDHIAKIQIVSLDHAWKKANEFQDYPIALKKLMGELCAATVLMASNIQFKGTVQLQLQGNGPVRLISVQCTNDLTLRSTADIRPEYAIKDTDTLETLLNADHQGRCIVILDPEDRPEGQAPYMGIVPIDGYDLADALNHYMLQSEQLDTHFLFASNNETAKGLILQKIPTEGGIQSHHDLEALESHWTHIKTYINTLSEDELLTTDGNTIIHRLFWEENMLSFPAESIEWRCDCSREKVSHMLKNLGQAEIESILAELGEVNVQCHSCNKPYRFDPIDCASLFIQNGQNTQNIQH